MHAAPMAGAPNRNWPPLEHRPNFAGVLFEQKASHNRGIRRGQRGNQEFYRFKVGCLGLRSHTQQQAILGL